MRAGVQIRGVGVVSPIGIGWPAFAQALRADAAPAPHVSTPALRGSTLWPAAPAHWVADFDARHWLGDKGVNALDRTTQLAVVACKEALRHAAVADDSQRTHSDIGVVLGSMAGGMRSIADFVRSTYTATPHMVSPMQFPNAVMNCAAGQCAIWHGLHGVNSTICAGELSGLAALQYASRMLRRQHAQRLLAGSVEEFCDFAAWSHAASGARGLQPLGEGAAVFALDAGRATGDGPAQAELLAVGLRVVPAAAGEEQPSDAALAAGLAAEIGRALRAADADPAALCWWTGRAGGGLQRSGVEQQALALAGVGSGVVALPPRVLERCGHTYAASESLQLAGALALAPEGLGLMTAVSLQGQVGCALLRMPAAGPAH